MKISIAGIGVVGSALRQWYRSYTNFEIHLYDPPLGLSHAPARDVEAVFVCVPAETVEGERSVNLSVIREVLSFYKQHCSKATFYIRSTVPPGTADTLKTWSGMEIVAMPEFLTERVAFGDFCRMPILSGGVNNGEVQRITKAALPRKEVIFLENKEAEFTKYAHNCYGAMLVNYFNIVNVSADTLGANYQRVIGALLALGHMNELYTNVPGPDGKYGFGGKCFPKDLSAFIGLLEKRGLPGSDTLRSIEADNEQFRERECDKLPMQ